MSYQLDEDLAPAMAGLAAWAAEAQTPARGDWQAVRTAAAGLAYMDTLTPASPDVTTTSFTAPTSDGDGDALVRQGQHRAGPGGRLRSRRDQVGVVAAI